MISDGKRNSDLFPLNFIAGFDLGSCISCGDPKLFLSICSPCGLRVWVSHRKAKIRGFLLPFQMDTAGPCFLIHAAHVFFLSICICSIYRPYVALRGFTSRSHSIHQCAAPPFPPGTRGHS
ncbi:hypothetical protein CDAR_311381 [Caerostris darwini]|uniref:Uncharacterized protein n=1 Tax=Caerostris darwini TaxID=1538125 RepID=A0AAV4UT10_9ARAC|nr:hypothetical protein CDAR_311381 [Caerostris darwini]